MLADFSNLITVGLWGVVREPSPSPPCPPFKLQTPPHLRWPWWCVHVAPPSGYPATGMGASRKQGCWVCVCSLRLTLQPTCREEDGPGIHRAQEEKCIPGSRPRSWEAAGGRGRAAQMLRRERGGRLLRHGSHTTRLTSLSLGSPRLLSSVPGDKRRCNK